MASFTQKMFDFSFREFIAPSVIKVLYVLALIAFAIQYVIAVVSGFASGFGYGLLALVLGELVLIILAILARVYLEVIMALFRMLGLLQGIAQAKGVDTEPQLEAPAAPAPAPTPPAPPAPPASIAAGCGRARLAALPGGPK